MRQRVALEFNKTQGSAKTLLLRPTTPYFVVKAFNVVGPLEPVLSTKDF